MKREDSKARPDTTWCFAPSSLYLYTLRPELTEADPTSRSCRVHVPSEDQILTVLTQHGDFCNYRLPETEADSSFITWHLFPSKEACQQPWGPLGGWAPAKCTEGAGGALWDQSLRDRWCGETPAATRWRQQGEWDPRVLSVSSWREESRLEVQIHRKAVRTV